MTTRYYSNFNTFDSYSTDNSWMNTGHAAMGYTDQVRHFMDSDEMENPFLQHPQGYGSGGYVLKAERVVEHVTRAPVVSIVMSEYRPHRNSGPEKAEMFIRDYGAERRYTRPGLVHDPHMQDFLGKIHTEVSQPISKVPAPFGSNWRAMSPTGKDANNKKGENKYDSDDDEKNSIRGNKGSYSAIPPGAHANPVTATNKYKFYERPNEVPVRADHTPLSRPVNDIKEGVEILTEGIRNIQSDVNRPSMAGNMGLRRWRNGPRMDSDSGDWDSVKEQNPHAMMNNKDYDKPEGTNKPASKLFGKSNSFPSVPQQQQPRFTVPTNQYKEESSYTELPRFTVPTSQHKEENSYTESIDSSEARKKYGKQKPQGVAVDPKAGIISSEDLIKKYNGAKVPW